MFLIFLSPSVEGTLRAVRFQDRFQGERKIVSRGKGERDASPWRRTCLPKRRRSINSCLGTGEPLMAAGRTGPQLETAHVLFVDIVAYSAQPMETQRRWWEELQSLVRQNA